MNTKEFLRELSDDDLCRSYGHIISILKERGIIRSKNVVGDLGEHLAIKHYCNTAGLPNLQPAPPGTQNVDALSRQGERYSIKSTTSSSTGVFYGLNEPENGELDVQMFEHVIIVVFDENYSIERINELTWVDFLKYKRWQSRMKAWYIGITNELLENTKTIYVADGD